MTPFQIQLRTMIRGTLKLAAFAVALLIIAAAFQVPLLGVILAVVLWTIVIRGQLWRY